MYLNSQWLQYRAEVLSFSKLKELHSGFRVSCRPYVVLFTKSCRFSIILLVPWKYSLSWKDVYICTSICNFQIEIINMQHVRWFRLSYDAHLRIFKALVQSGHGNELNVVFVIRIWQKILISNLQVTCCDFRLICYVL